MKVILFNGPPRCGKDTAAQACRMDRVVVFDRMSMPIKRAFAGTFNARIDALGDVPAFEPTKDTPLDLLGGKSYREWQIAFSETFMKPTYGDDIFARLFLARCAKLFSESVIVVPDCGFQVEADTIAASPLVTNYMVVQIHREGYDFSGDSRGYITAPNGETKVILNNERLEEYQSQIRLAVHHFLT